MNSSNFLRLWLLQRDNVFLTLAGLPRGLWFAYDVIKNMIVEIIINLLKILIWNIGSYSVSLYQIYSHLDKRKQTYRSQKLENFLLCYMGKWLLQHKCMQIFRKLNSRNSCIYWYVDLKLTNTFQNGVIYFV